MEPGPDCLVHGNIVLRDRVITGTIEIANGKITAIKQEEKISVNGSIPVIDATGKYVLPGAIEVHGHMREPGHAHKEDYITGTKAAIAGGVTTILDMPNTQPPTISQILLEQKVKMATGRAYSDFGIILGASRDNYHELESIDPSLIMGVKFFMAGHETTPTTMSNLGDLYRAFEILGRRKLLALVHAENQQLIDYLSSQYMVGQDLDEINYSRARGDVVVDLAVWEAVRLARATGTNLYLCHLSTPGELEAIQWAKSHNQMVFGEVAVYHLMFNTNDYKSLGSRLKVSPAIRNPETQRRLWDYVFHDGLVDTICSEHTPHLLSEKPNDIQKASSGMPGIQEARAALITGYFESELKNHMLVESFLVKLSNLTATNVANTFGLSQKGEIVPGKDADLVMLDVNKGLEIQDSNLFSKCGWSPYAGKILRGIPEMTVLRGKIVYRDGQFVEGPFGNYLKHGSD